MHESNEVTGVEAPHKHLTGHLIRSKYSKAKSRPVKIKGFLHEEAICLCSEYHQKEHQ